MKKNQILYTKTLQKNPLGSFNHLFINNLKNDEYFIKWFIGFFEAEGSFIIRNRGDIQFVLTQGYRNIFVLYHIKAFFGLGRVIKQGKQTFRFVIQDYDGLLYMINIFNGNIVLEKKKQKFQLFINAFNQYYGTNVAFINKDFIPTLNDAWFSGFIDGDGCFAINYMKIKKCFRISFSCAQKEDISFLKNIFHQGYHNYHPSTKAYHFMIQQNISFKSYEKKNIETNFHQVIEYFQKFPLRTTKINSYSLWFYIKNQLLYTTMKPEKEASLKFLCKLINIANDSEAINLFIETQEEVQSNF